MTSVEQIARVGLVTCAALPTGDIDDVHLVSALERAGAQPRWIVWNDTDPGLLHREVDIAILRSTWDYPEKLAEFLAWVGDLSVPMHNPREIVQWNCNKGYMLDLAAAGVPTIPTQVLGSLDEPWEVPADFAEFVVKPAVGAGSRGARRFERVDVQAADEHARSIIAAGNMALVQPYLPSVDRGSETALIHFDGHFSHSITKGPMLAKDGTGELVDMLYLRESIGDRAASTVQREVARAALAAVPGDTPLYARVDLIDGEDGAPMVLELELIEPSLFFGFGPGAADTFARAILARS